MMLTEFLLARIAEDEAAAKDEDLSTFTMRPFDQMYGETALGPYLTVDPARVLAECEAKRRIVDRCQQVLAVDGWEYDDAPDLAEDALSHLAAVYAAHPDYRQEWRP